MDNPVLGGIEGGGGHSVIVLFSAKGEKLVECHGPSTNHWLVGMAECQKRIHDMVQEALQKAGLQQDLTLLSLGLSLSGCEDEETNEELKNGLLEKYPKLCQKIYIASDTIGAIATASENGGLVLIAGTGSNSLLLNPDRSTARCGGWGYLLGDEGSAFWVAQKAIKIVFDEQDNRRPPPCDTTFIKQAILLHFNVRDMTGLLDHFYAHFNKAAIAGLAVKLAHGASEQNDACCQWLFKHAGQSLGEYVSSVLPFAHKSLIESPGGLPIICVGAVWGSWALMKEGFLEGVVSRKGVKPASEPLREFSLLRLQSSLAVGAAYLGAKEANWDLPRDYSQNAEIFFHHAFQ